MIIKNREELSISKLRKQALEIIEAGVERVLPSTLMKTALNYDSKRGILFINNVPHNLAGRRIFVIGGGKASGLMAQALEEIIGLENITDGVVNCKSSDYKTGKIKIIAAGHPIPDERGVNGVEQMLELKSRYSINENDLALCLISGGGSALMPYPVEGVSLEDKQKITELLLNSGAGIEEINIVRKHLSKIKGGRLCQFFAPATVVSLIMSDVIGNKLEAISSGPTFADSSTFFDASDVLERHNLLSKAPRSIVDFFEKGRCGKAKETPKILDNCYNHIIGDNQMALEAMSKKAKEMDLSPYIITDEQLGEPTALAQLRANEMLKGRYAGDYNVIIIGGETTPKLAAHHGKGGRNQHYAAASMLAMQKYPDEWALASVCTDGSDFLQGMAGAIVDNKTLARAESKGINTQSYLEKYDSNTLFEKIGSSLIVTGDTGTNVGDIMVYVLK